MTESSEQCVLYVVFRRRKRLCVRAEISDNKLTKICSMCSEIVPNRDMIGWGKGDICRECSRHKRWSQLNSAQRWYHNQRMRAVCEGCGFKGTLQPKCMSNVLPPGQKRERHQRPLELAKHNQLDDLNMEVRRGKWLCMCCQRKLRHECFADEVQCDNLCDDSGATELPILFDPDVYQQQSMILRVLQKAHGGCADCGLLVSDDNWMVFDWDHVNPAHKCFSVGMSIGMMNTEQLCREVSKCDLRCANCHCIRTLKENHSELRRSGEQRNIDFFVKFHPSGTKGTQCVQTVNPFF